MATGVGGGTVRDLILDRHPVFWIRDLRWLGGIAGPGGLTFAYTSLFRPPVQSLEVSDALGLAVFTVVRARVALGVEAPPVVVVSMAAITATVGGMVRDVLCGETPLILREEIYAAAALAGGVVLLILRALKVPKAAVVGITVVGFSLRGSLRFRGNCTFRRFRSTTCEWGHWRMQRVQAPSGSSRCL